MSENWVPPFQLETISLAKCYLGPQFPKWIKTQKNFSHIDISYASISDTVPDWFWDLSHSVEYMDLSNNELRKCRHDFSQKFKLKTLDLSHNNFSCPLPRLPPNVRTLDLSNNLFYGLITKVCDILGVTNSMETLDLSFNNFSGVIPNCWTNGTEMIILNLAENNFSGLIPDSFGNLKYLHMLLMFNNNLSGKIPDTLRNCQVLTYLDLGSNRFWGPIPSWIGTDLQILKALLLRRNLFDENIPKTLCLLKSLAILDLSENQLRGEIPRCVYPAMTTNESMNEKSYMEFLTIKESLLNYLSTKNHTLLLRVKTFDIYFFGIFVQSFKTIDLSSNFLAHGIPDEIAKLVDLSSLNLSNNQLVGSIPSKIGEMKKMESFDLSRNQLSCTIPNGMVNMTFLEVLNLSYNTLSGKIPSGQQFNTFSNDSYEGNPHLCGFPLTETCPENGNTSFHDIHCSDSEGNVHEGDQSGLGIDSFYISMAIGFFTGFWVFWGCLIFITSWRHAYFRFLSNVNDRIYVTVVLAFAKLQRNILNQQSPL